MINKDDLRPGYKPKEYDYSMKKEWTRDDLPHEHEVWDDFMAGKSGEVWDCVSQDDLGAVLDTVVEYLNEHHPKPQTYDCGETIDALNHNRDALIENREQSISSLQRLLATAEANRNRWRRARNTPAASRIAIEHAIMAAGVVNAGYVDGVADNICALFGIED